MPTYNPKISLGTAALNPAVFQGAVFTPVKQDMSLLQHSIDKLDERKEKTDQQRAALKAAIGKVQLNAAEDAWKTDYINRLSSRIDSAAQFGDYSTALEEATRLAGEAASSPELLGRERANIKYQEELKKIQGNNQLDELTKQRWMAVNPYKYEDIRDDNGNIIGGSEWKASFTPVADVNIASLRALAAQMTAEESGGSGGTTTRQKLLDANGKETTDFNQASDIKLTTSSGGSTQYAKKTKEKMTRVWNSLKADSTILQGLNQKYETLRWAYEDAQHKMNDFTISDEERARYAREVESYKSQIADKDGIIYSNAETWAQANIIPGFADMEYNNRHTRGDSSITYNDSYFTKKSMRDAQAANNADATVTENTGVVGTGIIVPYAWTPSYGSASAFGYLFNGDTKTNTED